jgi:aerobic-type carbon monoxide dehydrogenase small subunit (CoxS/CutS family)
MIITFKLNGKKVEQEVEENKTLLDLLRADLGITSVKKGCETGECGACTVLLEGSPVTSCIVLASRIEGMSVQTIDGLANEPLMTELRQSFLDTGAIQCGFCTPGILISSYALLRDNPHPTEYDIKKQLEGNLCRCTGYVKIIEAILNAAGKSVYSIKLD